MQTEITGHVVEGLCYCVPCYEMEMAYGAASELPEMEVAQYPIYEGEEWVSVPRCYECKRSIPGLYGKLEGAGS